MSKYIILLCLLSFPSVVFSQVNTFSANINITTSIIQSIEVITVNSISFANTEAGQREIYVNPISDINAGFLIALGTPGIEFRLNFQQERQIINTQGEGFLTFTYEISGNSVENQGSSVLIEEDNESIIFNSEGTYYIWVGGRVNLENALPGNYEGDFTIEIDYI